MARATIFFNKAKNKHYKLMRSLFLSQTQSHLCGPSTLS